MSGFRKTIHRYGIHLVAIIGMVSIAIAIATYMLSHQRLYLPAWVPVVGTDFYSITAEFATAQAVTPGQGQTVNVAGVPVGEIGKVRLRDGKAVVELKIRRQHLPIYKDTTFLLRPKTSLNDMFIQMKPGTAGTAKVPEGGNIPLGQTKPTVNFDEFLSVLDQDTRDYLQLLLNGAREGLGGQGKNLRQGFKRFPTTGKLGTRITKLVAKRRKNIKRAIGNLALLAKELGDNSEQISSLIDSSSVTFESWASEQEAIRQVIQKAPGALGETADAAKAAKAVVQDGAVAFRDLEPLSKDLDRALKALRPFFRDQTAVTRDQFRPFARESKPLLEQLKPAASGLKKLAPDATAATKSFNHLLNIVANNPSGSEEGYLYWLAWFNQLNGTMFNIADANGPLRSGAILGTCSDYSSAGVAKLGANDMLKLMLSLIKLPDETDASCRARGAVK